MTTKLLKPCLAVLLVVVGAVSVWMFGAEIPADLLSPARHSVEIFDRHGRPLRTMLVDERTHRRPLILSDLPPYAIHAVLAAEDKRFYRHHGVDCLALIRAFGQAVRHQSFRSGASTITQQLVKLASPGQRTVMRKLEEIRTAMAVERAWTKDQILQEYLNRLEYGDLQQGMESAAGYYFGKSASALSIAEAAFLAALPNAPSRLNPHRNWEGARQRQRMILNRMLANGTISFTQHALATEESLVLQPRGNDFQAPHFVDLLLTRSELMPGNGGAIHTTLNLALNDYATQLIETQLALLADKNVGSAAMVVLHNPTGEVLVMAAAGNAMDAAAKQVNTAWMPRSAGSAIKPFTYILAMESGAFPGTVVPDVATSFATPTGVYRPNNYNRVFHGPVMLRDALGNSLNIAAIRTLELGGGPDRLLHLLRNLEFTTLGHSADHYGLGLTLGNGETRLAELANAYATIARMGIHRPLQFLQNGPSSHTPGRRVFSSSSAWMVTDMLADHSARASAFGLDSYLSLPFPAACKTGTSSNYRDNVAVGFTPEFTVAVWVGNADGTPMRKITGVTGAAPVMHEMLCQLHDQFGTSGFSSPPPDIQSVWIHPLLGKQVPGGSPGAVREWCASQPAMADDDDFDSMGNVQLSAAYAQWLDSSHHAIGTPVTVAAASDALAISSPDPGTIYFIDPDLPLDHQRAVFLTNGNHRVRWHCDTLVPSNEDDSSFLLRPGLHQITAKDPARDQEASTWIDVREW